MEGKHTKGKWELSEAKTGVSWYVVVTDEKHVCEISLHHKVGEKISEDAEEAEANANLIAQSPNMYTFMTDYVSAMDDKGKLTIHETALVDSAENILKEIA